VVMSDLSMNDLVCLAAEVWSANSLLLLFQMFTIKMQEGVVATSYKEGDKFHIDPMKLLPLERFTGGDEKGGGRGRGGTTPEL